MNIATILEERDLSGPQEPFHYTVNMEKILEDLEEEDTIVCMNGDEIFSVHKPMHKEEVLAAYKKVDRKVKPVPAVYPEDAKVDRRFPEDPLATLPQLPVRPPKFQPNGG